MGFCHRFSNHATSRARTKRLRYSRSSNVSIAGVDERRNRKKRAQGDLSKRGFEIRTGAWHRRCHRMPVEKEAVQVTDCDFEKLRGSFSFQFTSVHCKPLRQSTVPTPLTSSTAVKLLVQSVLTSALISKRSIDLCCAHTGIN